MIDYYDWAGGREAMLRFGPDTGPVVVVALPLFEEANRTHAFAVTMLRALAERGVAGALPDLPGQGESLVPTDAVRLAHLRDAFAAATRHAGRPAYALGIRSGALLDSAAMLGGRWHFAPSTGAELLRELERLRRAGGGDEYGGNLISPVLLGELPTAGAAQSRTIRLESDARPADRHVPGAPLWRRSEPDNDPALAALLADDIAAWVRSCES
ncbi:alpha/beta fold hydrolase [Sphingomonas psychrotolerans]|uniref:Alpha/beta hydrolase n=1 Tax=Sphingomonas psychrotolerans TaxID=1327635 RepID=A0A2K8MGZ1_9SPHN|nr:hypothetical protein [Sphingomonas psychrotolerans]ATY31816.1 hypothetical protein CVN68_07400 [Sphingomonas psychrotolerans]